MKLVILGEPAGKGRPKARNAGKFIQIYTPKETTHYESKVVHEYKSNYDGMQFNVNSELYVTIKAYFQIPKGHYRFHKKTNTLDLDGSGKMMLEGLVRPKKKPDTDNIAKICLDALNGIAYPDDSQVVELLVQKFYSEQPRVEIEIEEK